MYNDLTKEVLTIRLRRKRKRKPQFRKDRFASVKPAFPLLTTSNAPLLSARTPLDPIIRHIFAQDINLSDFCASQLLWKPQVPEPLLAVQQPAIIMPVSNRSQPDLVEHAVIEAAHILVRARFADKITTTFLAGCVFWREPVHCEVLRAIAYSPFGLHDEQLLAPLVQPYSDEITLCNHCRLPNCEAEVLL
jgi:hypothetical protein